MAGSVLISGEMLRFGAKICCRAASLPGILTGITSNDLPWLQIVLLGHLSLFGRTLS